MEYRQNHNFLDPRCSEIEEGDDGRVLNYEESDSMNILRDEDLYRSPDFRSPKNMPTSNLESCEKQSLVIDVDEPCYKDMPTPSLIETAC